MRRKSTGTSSITNACSSNTKELARSLRRSLHCSPESGGSRSYERKFSGIGLLAARVCLFEHY